MSFTEEEVTDTQEEVAVLHEHGHMLILVGGIVISYRIKQLYSLRLQERHAAW